MAPDLIIGIDSSTTATRAKAHPRIQELLGLHAELWPLISSWRAKLAVFSR